MWCEVAQAESKQKTESSAASGMYTRFEAAFPPVMPRDSTAGSW